MARQQSVDNGLCATNTAIDGDGVNGAISRTRPTFDAGVAVDNESFLFSNGKNPMGTNRFA